MERFFANLTLFASLLFLPWWITVALAVVFAFFLPSFYEAVAWGIFGDLAYAVPVAAFGGFPILMGTGAFFIIIGIEFLKKRLLL